MANTTRTGTGTIRRYLANRAMTFIGIERAVASPLGTFDRPIELDANRFSADPRTVFLTCDPELAGRLTDRYGVRQQDFTSMESIIGQPCRYVESACGMIVGLEVLRG